MNPIVIGLLSGLLFCAGLSWYGALKPRCILCKGRGYWEVTEAFADYEVTKSMRCPRGCAR